MVLFCRLGRFLSAKQALGTGQKDKNRVDAVVGWDKLALVAFHQLADRRQRWPTKSAVVGRRSRLRHT
jgi:hypothetical protein